MAASRKYPLAGPVALVAVVAAAAAVGYYSFRAPPAAQPAPAEAAEVTDEQVRQFCAACHAFPSPDTFPRETWREHVEVGYHFAAASGREFQPPPIAHVIAYYEQRAPLELVLSSRPSAAGPAPVRWQPRTYPGPDRNPFPTTTNVSVVRLRGGKPEVLVCECDPMKKGGTVSLFNPHGADPAWTVLARVPGPAHAEVVDLDGDGRLDVLVACLGSFFPTDEPVGSVVLLRGRADGTFDPVTLLRSVGRVADAQAADFNGDGKLDLVVAEFGWRKTGRVLLLENRTADWARPEFATRVLDDRPGAIHVPVADLNGDGKPDFVALISQEHETVVAFLNDGSGRFRKETVYAAPHPGYGSSSIQLADTDRDGDLDIVYANGDSLGEPFVVRPYQGVHWLENRGTYPFVPHRLADMPGVQRAIAADVDGDGDLDILAVGYLPAVEYPRDALDLDAVLLLEQTAKGTFVRRPLATKTCDHFSCAAADLFGTGRAALVVGNFYSTTDRPLAGAITVWSDPPK